jgi:predicted chitinase
MTTLQIKAVGCTAAANVQTLLSCLGETCDKFGINTPAAQLSFLAQASHESGSFFYTEELASGTAYEGRKDLGNTNPGDGVRFKGRGFIQITGRANYHAVGEALGADFISNPTLLGGKNIQACSPDQLKYAALSAGWFWSRCGLTAIADHIDLEKPIDEEPNLDLFKEITHKINGGYNGLPDRLHKFMQGLPQALSLLHINTAS